MSTVVLKYPFEYLPGVAANEQQVLSEVSLLDNSIRITAACRLRAGTEEIKLLGQYLGREIASIAITFRDDEQNEKEKEKEKESAVKYPTDKRRCGKSYGTQVCVLWEGHKDKHCDGSYWFLADGESEELWWKLPTRPGFEKYDTFQRAKFHNRRPLSPEVGLACEGWFLEIDEEGRSEAVYRDTRDCITASVGMSLDGKEFWTEGGPDLSIPRAVIVELLDLEAKANCGAGTTRD